MAEEPPRVHEPDADPRDDVLGKIDQLLSRHRPKPTAAAAVAMLRETSQRDAVTVGDGIPVLTDVVAGPEQSAMRPVAPTRSGTLSSAMLVRRLSLALDAEHARLSAQFGSDAEQAQMLDQLVAELKRTLPAAVRAATDAISSDPPQTLDDGPVP